jgi:hypothetical protein
MRRLVGAGVAVVFCAAVFGVPGIIAKGLVERPVANANFGVVFDYILKLAPRLALDHTHPVNRTEQGGGGTLAPIRCLRITSGARGWLCAALSPDGERFAAAWTVPRPDARPQQLILSDRDDSTVPNP